MNTPDDIVRRLIQIQITSYAHVVDHEKKIVRTRFTLADGFTFEVANQQLFEYYTWLDVNESKSRTKYMNLGILEQVIRTVYEKPRSKCHACAARCVVS